MGNSKLTKEQRTQTISMDPLPKNKTIGRYNGVDSVEEDERVLDRLRRNDPTLKSEISCRLPYEENKRILNRLR